MTVSYSDSLLDAGKPRLKDSLMMDPSVVVRMIQFLPLASRHSVNIQGPSFELVGVLCGSRGEVCNEVG